MSQARILFIDDDAAGQELATFNLVKAGYVVDVADSGD